MPLSLGPNAELGRGGVWLAEPPAVINPGQEVVFGSASKGLMFSGGIGATEGRLSYTAPERRQCRREEDAPWGPVEFALHWFNPLVSVAGVNERRCTAALTPPMGGCAIMHVGPTPDTHNNVVCITVADADAAGASTRALARDVLAAAAAADGAAAAAAAAEPEPEPEPEAPADLPPGAPALAGGWAPALADLPLLSLAEQVRADCPCCSPDLCFGFACLVSLE